MIGDSLVNHLENWAVKQSKHNLKLENTEVLWMGKRGMVWAQLRPLIQYQSMHRSAPAMIVIQLGGNDLSYIGIPELVDNIKSDVKYIQMLYPTSLIVWSDIIPRLSWRDVEIAFNKQMDLKRKRINRVGRSGEIIVHVSCEIKLSTLHRSAIQSLCYQLSVILLICLN